ncbi:MAG TPA: 5-oxoprolinase subunit PxpA [Albidovulum sp.]|uniref:LamB/YcsF family protein n=1 Tax=Albidovulum sp. TaxID=1872424 RepID=UPI002C32413B|nr:5-oxoprolinase subunit PxpA [Albidovulum sp.]
MRRVDLNADMGEGMGDDAAMLGIVTSANVACGFHAGDPDTMLRTMRMAVENGVGIGAHPGFADKEGFGRRRMVLPEESLANLIRYQVGAAAAMAKAAGGRLRHVKLHGAMSNMAATDRAMALTCYKAALEVQGDLILMVQAATEMEHAAVEMGALYAAEIFADRAYEEDGTLLDRSKPGAVLHDGAEAARRIAAMIAEGAIITASGKRIPSRIDTICVHGDTPGAVAMAGELRGVLEREGVRVAGI